MAGPGVPHHSHIGSHSLGNSHVHSNSDVSSETSSSSATHSIARSFPDNSGEGASGIAGFNPSATANRAGRFFARANTHGTGSVRSSASSRPSVGQRSLNGDESRSELIDIVGDLQEQIASLSRQLHDGAEGTDPHRQTQSRHQDPLEERRNTLEERRFQHQMRQMAQEEERMTRQQEHEDFKFAHQLQMQEFEKTKMEAKIQNMQDQQDQNEEVQRMQLITNAGQQAMNLTRQL